VSGWDLARRPRLPSASGTVTRVSAGLGLCVSSPMVGPLLPYTAEGLRLVVGGALILESDRVLAPATSSKLLAWPVQVWI
jgi:hypothetical protein